MKVLVEASKGSSLRIRYNEASFQEKSRRSLRQAYPYSYGFVPASNAPDGDCLDCFILTAQPLPPGSLVECVALDVFILDEDGEQDIKILARLADDPAAPDLKTCHDLIAAFLLEVFQDWPELKITVGPLLGKDRADAVLESRKVAGTRQGSRHGH
jgi:inorganic pyrophosphatase